MKFIEKIEIQYFRSIYWETIFDISDLNVFTGKNDVGKSNVLKALNLFFNNCIVEDNDFDFQENFNMYRAEEVRKNSIKGKQFIQIKVTFLRGAGMSKTLPPQFTVSKKWLRYGAEPVTTDDLESRCKNSGLKYNDRTKSSLTKFLNLFRYVYVPAIKDNRIFTSIISMLQDTLYNERLTKNKRLLDSLSGLADSVQKSATELNTEFFTATKVSANISSPKSITEFYSTLSIDTQFGNNFSIKLDNRGDGIRVRYLPSILNYLATNSKKKIIWGFEEPETSTEYNLAINMANSFATDYSKRSMIFLTSHSPAFINLAGANIRLNRCVSEENKTRIYSAEEVSAQDCLAFELGYFQIQKELYQEYLKKRTALIESLHEISQLSNQIKQYEKPALVTEGKSDVAILKTAWEKLYPHVVRPFEIVSCDAVGDGSAAGCSMLTNFLNSYRYDAPHKVLGLYDYDDAGIKAYGKLSNNFVEINNWQKISSNNKAFAMFLPQLQSRSQFIAYRNFCIEFMFDMDYLNMRIDGKGLELVDGSTFEQFNGVTIEQHIRDELWFKKIKENTKVYFSEKVVSAFPVQAFKNFIALFDAAKQFLL